MLMLHDSVLQRCASPEFEKICQWCETHRTGQDRTDLLSCPERRLLETSELQSQHPPCMTRQSGWYQCVSDAGQSPGALCLPLCIGDTAQGPCQPCSDANKACNTVRPSLTLFALLSLQVSHPKCGCGYPPASWVLHPCHACFQGGPKPASVLHEQSHANTLQAWSSYGGKLQASLSFNSTDICPQLASKMTEGALLQQSHSHCWQAGCIRNLVRHG